MAYEEFANRLGEHGGIWNWVAVAFGLLFPSWVALRARVGGRVEWVISAAPFAIAWVCAVGIGLVVMVFPALFGLFDKEHIIEPAMWGLLAIGPGYFIAATLNFAIGGPILPRGWRI